MTKQYLFEYSCQRCNRLARTTIEVQDDTDKAIVKMFYAMAYEEHLFCVLLNDVYKRLKIARSLLCSKCRKNIDLRQFTTETIRAEGLCPTCRKITPHVMTDNEFACVVCQK
jgi:rubrerythrin